MVLTASPVAVVDAANAAKADVQPAAPAKASSEKSPAATQEPAGDAGAETEPNSLETTEQAGSFAGMDELGIDEIFGFEEEESEPDHGTADPDLSEEDLEDATPGAQKRIRTLVGRLKQATGELEQMRSWGQQAATQYQQLAQQNQQMQQQLHQMQVRFARAQAQMETVQKYTPRPDERDLDPADRFKSEILTEAEKKVLGRLQPQFKQMQDSHRKLQDELKAKEAQAQSEARRNRFRQETNEAAAHILDGYPEKLKGELSHWVGNYVLHLAAAQGKTIPEVVPAAKRFFLQMGYGRAKAWAASKGSKVKASQSITPPAKRGRSGATRNGAPSASEARKAGYKDPLEAMMASGGLKNGSLGR